MTENELEQGAGEALARARELFSSAIAGGRELACFVLSIDRLGRYEDPALRDLLRTAVEGVVLSEPEGAHWRVLRTGDELLVLCHGLALAEAGTAARGLIDGVRRLRVRRAERQLRPRVSIGMAHTKNRSELSFEILLGVARESLGVAQAAGGDRWVHTELYDLLIRRSRSAQVDAEAASAFEELAAGFEPPAEPEPQSAAAHEQLIPAAPSRALEPVPLPVAGPRDAFEEARALGAGGAGGTGGTGESVEVLQRRIMKLLEALDLAEGEILRLQREFGTKEGIASIYRSVQGLAPDEPLLETKRRLMRELYRANRALGKAAS